MTLIKQGLTNSVMRNFKLTLKNECDKKKKEKKKSHKK